MSQTTAQGKERLDKLIDAVASEREFKFDWADFRNECGTAGCAAGLLPKLDPENWEWVKSWSGAFFPRLKWSERDTQLDLESYFGIDEGTCAQLFYPGSAEGQPARSCDRATWVRYARKIVAELEVV